MKDQWIASLDMRDFPSLDALSGSLSSYVRSYNLSAHSSLKGKSPQERFFCEPQKIRRLPEEKLKTDFLLELERRVSADSVVSIGNVEYEVDMRFARQKIRLRCSPDMGEVYVDMDIFSEKFCPQDGFQKIHSFLHGLSCFCFVIDSKENPCIHKLEGLDKGTVCFVIINSVHLCNKNIWIFRYVFFVIFVGTSLKIFAVDALFVSFGLLFGNLA